MNVRYNSFNKTDVTSLSNSLGILTLSGMRHVSLQCLECLDKLNMTVLEARPYVTCASEYCSIMPNKEN